MRYVCAMLLMVLLTMTGGHWRNPPGVVIDYQPAASREVHRIAFHRDCA